MKPMYLTVGELSKLYGVSKQTLLYYEKMELFTPYVVEENGYRYYTVKECEDLEIILHLKKLNIPLKDIKLYLEEKDSKLLEHLLRNAREDFDKQIEDLYGKKMKLEMALYGLERYEKMPRDVVFFQMEEEQQYVISPLYDVNPTSKEGVKRLLNHQATLLSTEDYWRFHIGYAVAAEDYERGDVTTYSAYCSNIGIELLDHDLETYVRPRGMYVSIYIEGDYDEQSQKVYEQIMRFLGENGLDISGPVFIEPLRNFWTEKDPTTYLTKISVPVEKK